MDQIRYYKGKYKCRILDIKGKKALVQWIDSCDCVGDKRYGYKSIIPGDYDIIVNYRLLYRNKRD